MAARIGTACVAARHDRAHITVASPLQPRLYMPQKRPSIPRSYEEIVRKTVPNLDSSWRPSEEQVRDAYAGKHVHTREEEVLLHRVNEVLLDTPGIDLCGLEIEVDDTRVILRGHCANPSAIQRVVRAVSSMEEVSDVVDQLVVNAEPR